MTREMHPSTLAAAIALCLGVSCSAPPSQEASAAAARPQLGEWGLDLTAMDTSVKPGDDFYGYVNGAWQARTEIPADKRAVGPANSLQDLALDQIKTLLDEAAADTSAAPGSDHQKLGDWYASLLDEEKLVSLGLSPIQPDLDRIQAITDRSALADLLADNLGDLGASPLVVSWEFDRKQAGKTLVSVDIAGLSLPARELYLADEYEPVRTLYRQHIAQVFQTAGIDDADRRAARVVGLEVRIAEFTWPLEEKRDPRKLFNPTPAGQLATIAPGIDWSRFLERAGVGSAQIVDVTTRSSIAGMARLIADAPLADWKDYATYQLLRSVSSALPKAFRDQFFAFYGKALGGQAEPDPRWKEAVLAFAWGPLGDTLGKAFIERDVPPEARPQAREMIDNLVKAFDARLEELEWMTPETRTGARDKLAKTTIKVIYPDLWNGTDGLEVVRGDAIGNQRRAAAWSRQHDLAYLQKEPDRRLFFKPVYEVNAYANPAWNETVFLAGIVRPPFFDPAADVAVNYGAMGAVIGHEISHLFDDQGRLSDGDGLLRDWWTPEDAEKFVAVTDRLAEQVSTYEPLPGKHVNGRLTLGESIADVAGLTVAYDALQLYLDGRELPVLDGFTADQRFFLAYAQAWRLKATTAYQDQLLNRDPHPPSSVRPQTVRNVDAWYAAFNIQPGDKLYLAPGDRINPW